MGGISRYWIYSEYSGAPKRRFGARDTAPPVIWRDGAHFPHLLTALKGRAAGRLRLVSKIRATDGYRRRLGVLAKRWRRGPIYGPVALLEMVDRLVTPPILYRISTLAD